MAITRLKLTSCSSEAERRTLRGPLLHRLRRKLDFVLGSTLQLHNGSDTLCYRAMRWNTNSTPAGLCQFGRRIDHSGRRLKMVSGINLIPVMI
jgi:hypothetical protein